jgi:PAS domain S-box-containing protein
MSRPIHAERAAAGTLALNRGAWMPRTTTNPVIVFDDTGRVVEANPAAAELTGTPLEELRGMHLRDFYHPDELPDVERLLRVMPIDREIRAERWLRCCNRRYVRVAVKGSRRAVGGYRVEYEPLASESIDLPARLPPNVRQDFTRR